MAEEDPPPNSPPNSNPDPFEDWYKNTIQAHPERYDPAHFTKEQARAWFPLWDASSGGFRSSKVDRNGQPIAGNTFAHPDECPPGTQAYGQNQCVNVGEVPGQGGGGHGPYDQGGQAPPFYGGNYKAPWMMGQEDFLSAPKFDFPTAEGMLKDPGYQFRLKQGIGGVESSAAARGVLNAGGTLQDVDKFGQDYAASEFGNMWNRAKDLYAPQLADWQFRVGQQAQNRQRGFEGYQFNINDLFRKEQMRRDDEYRRQQMILQSQPPGY